jgi:hypothetical protein
MSESKKRRTHTAEFKAKVGLETVSQFTQVKESQQFSESCSCVVFVQGFAALNDFYDVDRSIPRSGQAVYAACPTPLLRPWRQAEGRAGAQSILRRCPNNELVSSGHP